MMTQGHLQDACITLATSLDALHEREGQAGSAAVVLGRGRGLRGRAVLTQSNLFACPGHGTKIIRPASLTPNPPIPRSLDTGTASRGLGEGPGRAHYSGRRKHGHGHCGGTAWHFPEAQGVCAGRQAGLGDVRGHDSIVEQGGDAEGRGPAIDWWIGRGGVPELFWEPGK